AKEGRTWPIPNNWEKVSHSDSLGFVLEPVISRTLGEPSMVLVQPTGNDDRPVIALTWEIVSLSPASCEPSPCAEPVLPGGFSFAVLGDDGKTLLHSHPGLHVEENFFVESDLDGALRSAVASRREASMDLDYFGRRYLAHVFPLDSVPEWSIVVMAENEL